MTYAHDAHCNVIHTAGPEECPPFCDDEGHIRESGACPSCGSEVRPPVVNTVASSFIPLLIDPDCVFRPSEELARLQETSGTFSGFFDAAQEPPLPEPRVASVTYVYPRPWWRKLLFLPARKKNLGSFRFTYERGPDGEIVMNGERED